MAFVLAPPLPEAEFIDLPPAMPEDENDDRSLPDPEYKVKWAVEVPVTAALSAWTLYCFTEIYVKPPTPIEEVQALNTDEMWAIDRWAAGRTNRKSEKISDYLFYGAIPVPLIAMALDPAQRDDFGHLAFLFWETMAITGTLYTSATYFNDRFRPEAYNFSKPAEERTSGNLRNSFFAGHPAQVGALTFFTAKIFNDYHPDSKWKWAFWGTAAAATGATAYLRLDAGKHFPTDLLIGTGLGVAAGILVPQLHKTKRVDGSGLSLTPLVGPRTNGFSLAYRF